MDSPDRGENRTHHRKGHRRRSAATIIPHLNHTASRWALLPVLLVVWLGPFLGGGVESWAMATIYCLLAALFIIYPVAHSLKPRMRYFLAAVLLLPLTAFLPVSVAGTPEWRSALTQDFGIQFPWTISPQPWLSLDSYLAWLGGAAWVYWLSGQGWTREIRKPLAELFAIGILIITVVGLIGYHTGHPLPFWHAERLFGPFPNRNQTANLLSLTFVLMVALLHMAVLKRARIAALWIVGLLVIGYGLILNFSRSGIILPVIGVGAYWMITVLNQPSRKKIWIGVASIFLVFALFLAFGGETLDRFVSGENRQSLTADFRRLIFRDTLAMTEAQPVVGVGLSAFPQVFPLFRKLAVVDSGIIHPESDWLWLASEIGWPGALLIFAAAAWFTVRAFLGALKRPHPLRLASAIAGGLFVLHGFFDVSGHRFGTFFPACFLFALAWPGQMAAKSVSPRRCYAIALGLTLIATGWFINLGQPPLWPSRAALATIKKQATLQIDLHHGDAAFAATNDALRWAPLDWQLYYQRGTSRILNRRDWADSLRDYQRANFLERSSLITPENEGIAWLSYRPELAALPWTEALRRMTPDEANKKYARYLEMAAPYPRLRSQLEVMASNSVPRSIILLQTVEKSRFAQMLDAFRKQHPQLDQLQPSEQRALFDVWVGKGNSSEALEILRHSPGLLPNCNIPLASAMAREGQFQQGYELALRTVPPPNIPELASRASEVELTREFYAQKSLNPGIALYHLQIAREDTYGALSTLERLQTFPEAPVYLRYFEARLQAANGNWEKAWAALENYIFRSGL